MSEQQTRDDPVGRSKHLGELAMVFKHRHAKWHHFADFLREEFSDRSVAGPNADVTPPLLQQVACRHNNGGRNHTALSTANNGPFQSAFNHVRYQRPCVTMGTYDEKKNPGLVVHDLCTRAVRFLARIGLGDPDEETKRDFKFDPTVYSACRSSEDSLPPFQSDDFEGLSTSNIRLSPRRARAEEDEDDEYGGDEFFQQEDVQEFLFAATDHGVPISEFDPDASVSAPGMGSSSDSVGQGTLGRKPTKMRVATLAYLWGFVSDPQALRREFRKLRTSPNLHVLHLCGCGMCYKQPDGSRVYGCCEASHLILGSSSLNDMHRTYHTMISLLPPENYLLQVSLFRHALDESGMGVF